MAIRKLIKEDYLDVFLIMNRLSDWFNEDALNHIEIDLKFQSGFVAKDASDHTIGFLTFFVYEAVAYLAWIGVIPEHHRMGIGKKLLGAFENEIKKSGIRVIQVYTLSDIVSYHPYEATRSFYYQCGFYEYRRIQTNNPECLEELHLRKNLDSYES